MSVDNAQGRMYIAFSSKINVFDLTGQALGNWSAPTGTAGVAVAADGSLYYTSGGYAYVTHSSANGTALAVRRGSFSYDWVRHRSAVPRLL